MEIIQIIVPIFTFFLGALFTFLYWKADRKKRKESESVQEVAKLVNEWYEQLHDIYIHKSISDLKIQEYSQNRKVLPKLLQHLEILRNKKKYESFVKAADEFVFILTYNSESEDTKLCSPIRMVATILANLQSGVEKTESLDILLSETDKKLQKINIQAGKILQKL